MKIQARFEKLSEIKKLFPKDIEVVGVGVSAFQRSGLGYILPNYTILALLETADLPAIRQICPVTTIEKNLGGERPERLNTSSILRLKSVNKFLQSRQLRRAQSSASASSPDILRATFAADCINLFVYKAATPLDEIIKDLPACAGRPVKLLSSPGRIRKPLEDKKVFREEAVKAGIKIPRGENLLISGLTQKKWDKLRQKYGDLPAQAGKLVFQLTDYSTGGGQGTFFVNKQEDWKRFGEFTKSEERKKELKFVNVCERIEGRAASISGCATKYGTVTGILQTQIMDQPELVGFRGRSGVWLGHDWNVRFSEKAQYNAESLCKKWGEYIYQKGYKGIFGLDVVVSDENDEVTIIECNSRYTGAFPVYTMMQLAQGEMPLDVWHLLEWLGLDYEMDIDEIQKASREPKKGAQIILHNREEREVRPRRQLKAGVYKLTARQTKFSACLSAQAGSHLPGEARGCARQNLCACAVEYLRPGFSLMDIKGDNEFVLADRVPNKGQTIKVGERMGKLIFKRRIIDEKGNLLPDIRGLVETIYFGFSLQGVSS